MALAALGFPATRSTTRPTRCPASSLRKVTGPGSRDPGAAAGPSLGHRDRPAVQADAAPGRLSRLVTCVPGAATRRRRRRGSPGAGPLGGAATQLIGEDWARARKYFSLSEKYAAWADYCTPARGFGIHAYAHKVRRPIRSPTMRCGLIRSGGISAAMRVAIPRCGAGSPFP